MAPMLRNGIPVNQRQRILPVILVLCRCTECQSIETYDAASDTVVAGNRIPYSMFKIHRQRDAERRVALNSNYRGIDMVPLSTSARSAVVPGIPEGIHPSAPLGFAHKVETSIAGEQTDLTPSSRAVDPSLPKNSNRKQRRLQASKTALIAHTVSPDSQLNAIRSWVREGLSKTLSDIIQDQPLAFVRLPIKYQRPSAPGPPASEIPPLHQNSAEPAVEAFSQATPSITEDPLLSEADTLELKKDAPENSVILQHEAWLVETRILIETQLQRNPHQFSSHDRLLAAVTLKDLKREEANVLAIKERDWQRQCQAVPENSIPIIDSSPFYLSRAKLLSPLSGLCCLLVTILHLLANVSLDDCSLALAFLSLILQQSMKDSMKLEREKLATSLPADVRTVVKALKVEPEYTAFLCCPGCFCTYPLDPNALDSYPEFCSYKQTPQSEPCGSRLRNTSGPETSRQFLYQHLPQWIARMYSRPDIEDHFDNYPKHASRLEERGLKDIWNGTMLQTFCDSDGRPFMEIHGNEGRLVFGLNTDGFNPFSKKTGGKTVSVGAVYLVCYNLPPNIRYKPENIFLVGVIPGPEEPSLCEINHILRPLVDDLVGLWNDGVYVTRTTKHPLGRAVRCAMLPLVCDLPAARRTAGLGSHSSRHFCSECDIVLEDINDPDLGGRQRRTRDDHIKYAEKWKEANSESAQETEFQDHGVRWSELLRLPYWDATEHVAIDPMHGFYLRMFYRHIRDIWGMDVTIQDGDGTSPKLEFLSKVSEDDKKNAHFILENGSVDQVEKLPVYVLRYLCHHADLPFDERKKKLVESLIRYRVDKKWFTEDGIVVSLVQGPTDTVDSSIHRAVDGPSHTIPVLRAPTREEFTDHVITNVSNSKIKNFSRAILVALCAVRFQKRDHEFLAQDRKSLAQTLIDSRDGDISPRAPATTKVLGKETLAAIRDDMQRLGLPSHVLRAPKHPGEVKWGNFKAAEWKSFCTVNLPITLIRLWGYRAEDDRYHKMLANFLDLVAAVKLAESRVISEEEINSFERYIRSYLEGLRELYPHVSLTPYQHLALHLGDQLRRFGPTHSWRCFAFERYNGMLQKIPTNGKLGEMEQTMFKQFCRTQNLRALVSKYHISEELHPAVEAFEKRYGFNMNDILGPGEPSDVQEQVQGATNTIPTPPHLQVALYALISKGTVEVGRISRHMSVVEGIRRFNQLFQAMPHSNNAHVAFLRSPDSNWSAGVLGLIFTQKRWSVNHDPVDEAFAIVREYENLEESNFSKDAYRRFSLAGGQLRYNRFRSQPILVPFKNIISHISYMPLYIPGLGEQCLHVLPL